MSIAVHEIGHIAVGLQRSPEVIVKRQADSYEVVPSSPPEDAEQALDGMCAGIIGEHLHRLGSAAKVQSYLRTVGVPEFLDTQIGVHDAALLRLLPKFKLSEIIDRVCPVIAMELAHPTLIFEFEEWLQSMKVGESRLIKFDAQGN